MRQLDLFADGRDTMLRGDVATALLAEDLGAAEAALEKLDAEFPDDGCIANGRRLLADLKRESQAGERPAAADEVQAGAVWIEGGQRSAAQAVLGDGAVAWRRRRWAHLAHRARGLTFNREQPQGHAAACWLHAQRWAEAEAAVSGIESWRRIPQPVLWMLEARWHHAGPDAAWPLVAEACWLAPAGAAELLPRLGAAADGAPLARLLRGFGRAEGIGDTSDGDADPTAADAAAAAEAASAWAWFPAWALVEQPLLRPALALAEPPAGVAAARAMGLVAAALRLERQGRPAELLGIRRQMQSLSNALFSFYMSTR